MYLPAYNRHFCSWKKKDGVVLSFHVQVLEVRGDFVFSVSGASRVGFGNRKRRWKAGSESYLMTEVGIACVQVLSLSKSLCNRLLLIPNKNGRPS